MNILVSNDDGYQAPGILSLAEALRELGRVVIVAPDRNRSGASSSLTLTAPINTIPRGEDIYAVEGTPADCINVALGGLVSFKPDLVVSGINDGPNMADDSIYSGTVAAAVEGRFLALPSIAVSMATFHPVHFDTAASITVDLVRKIKQADFPTNTVLNVNVPDVPLDQIKGLRATRLGSRSAPEPAAEHPNPRGQAMYWLGPAGLEDDNTNGTDFHAVSEGYVSVTPLSIDMTRHDLMGNVQTWVNNTVC